MVHYHLLIVLAWFAQTKQIKKSGGFSNHHQVQRVWFHIYIVRFSQGKEGRSWELGITLPDI